MYCLLAGYIIHTTFYQYQNSLLNIGSRLNWFKLYVPGNLDILHWPLHMLVPPIPKGSFLFGWFSWGKWFLKGYCPWNKKSNIFCSLGICDICLRPKATVHSGLKSGYRISTYQHKLQPHHRKWWLIHELLLEMTFVRLDEVPSWEVTCPFPTACLKMMSLFPRWEIC